VVDIETALDRACADLSVLDAGLHLEDVTWSPDSSRLAFSERTFQTFLDGDLWVMDAETGALTNVDDDGFEGTVPILRPEPDQTLVSMPVNPAFSPDSTMLAFSRGIIENGTRRTTIARVPVEGGPITDLRTVAYDVGLVYFGIAWAPDGASIYLSYQANDSEDLRNGIWVMDAGGSNARLLVGRTQDTHGPSVLDVSSDGAWLLLQDPDAMGSYANQLPVYWVADTAHGVPAALVPTSGIDAKHGYVGWAGFSPDAQWLLVLERRFIDPEYVVRVRSVDGTIDEPLLAEGLEMAGPVDRGIALTWSENGTAFLTGAGMLDTGTLLTIEGGTTP
jgi:dipeptidyl aminopeptidase/acylaminoacyl peptidase